jgi:hypothetical protein
MFEPHPNLSDAINDGIVRSEVEGGVYVQNLSDDRPLEVQTQHRSYFVLRRNSGDTVIWGHPVYCPEPVPVAISGSNWGGSMLKIGFIGRGMHLEFRHPDYPLPIVTSRIEDMRELDADEQPPMLERSAPDPAFSR